MSTDIIYMIDTNVLVDWLAALTPASENPKNHFDPKMGKRIRQFCENNAHQIHVPDIVWAEFLGVVLHKNMDVSQDLQHLRHWFQQRESYIQQIEAVLFEKHTFFNWESDRSPFPDADEVVRDLSLIDQKTFAWMSRSQNRAKGTEKLLDGMDAVIMIYLNELALKYPRKRVVLFTGDFRMFRVFSRIREHYRDPDFFARNTASTCSLFSTVRCSCRHESDHTILMKPQIRCQKCRRLIF